MLTRLTPRIGRDGGVIIAAASLRSLDYGFISVFLGVYLTLLEFTAVQAGFVFSAIMAGSMLSNLIASRWGDAIGRRRLLVALAALMAAGGAMFTASSEVAALMLVGVFAVTTSSGGDRTAFISLDTAMLAQVCAPRQRTLAFSWYNLATIMAKALGALLIALPALLQQWTGAGELLSYKAMFWGYAALACGGMALYGRLSPRVEARARARDGEGGGSQRRDGGAAGKDADRAAGASASSDANSAAGASSPSVASTSDKGRGVIWKMTGLSALDALGGGFTVRSFISFWFASEFGVDLFSISGIFFAAQLLNVASVALAPAVASRIGLVNTMAFTQVAANLMFVGMAFAGELWVAVAFFLLHESCNDMDVPTRQSYTMAIVPPESRTAMATMNNLGRNAAQTISPSLAGAIAASLSFGAPFLVGAATKLVYNALLLGMFRGIKVPEER